MKIGFDVDGVLADFNTTFIERVIRVTGRDLFPARPFQIPCWDYPQYYGYTPEENRAIWANVKADPTFWLTLDPLPEAETVLARLRALSTVHDLYFVSSRPGLRTKTQTEVWLSTHSGDFLWNPTVLISSDKGACARALRLDAYIDDNWDNCMDVALCTKPAPEKMPTCRTFCLDQPWNGGHVHADIWRVKYASIMLDVLLAGFTQTQAA